MAGRGDKNSQWKGGTFVNTNGYLRIGAGPLRGKYVHTIVAEAMLGRALREDETVHHKDADRLNPSPDNLEVVPRDENSREMRHRVLAGGEA